MREVRRVAAAALVLAAVAGSAQSVRAQERETVVDEGSTGKVPYYVAEVPFQLYETPPEPIPFFRFLLSSPDEKDMVMDRGTNFLVLERRVINRLGERSLWWLVEEMRTTEEQQGHPIGMRTTEEQQGHPMGMRTTEEQQGRPAGWIYAGFEPAGGVDDPNLNPWWSLEGVVDASEAGLKTSKSTSKTTDR